MTVSDQPVATEHPTCPPWCQFHGRSEPNAQLHYGSPIQLELPGPDGLTETVQVTLARFDFGGEPGPEHVEFGRRGASLGEGPGWVDMFDTPLSIGAVGALSAALQRLTQEAGQ